MTALRDSLVFTPASSTARVWLSPRRLLIVAAIFHVALTITSFLLGRHEILPGTFDNNGIGVSFAVDGIQHRSDAAALSDVLSRGGVVAWLTAPYPLHDKLYSICFALFGPLLGINILSVEPLNALFYLAILVLVFNLGREAFNRRVGLVASATIAVWPSFLLHTTQMLKDPLFIVGMLALVLIILRWLTRTYSWRGALLTGAFGGLIAATLWLARDAMGEVVIAILLLGAAMLVARQFAERRIQITSLIGMALLIAITISAQQVLPKARRAGDASAAVASAVKQQTPPSDGVSATIPVTTAEASTTNLSSRMATRVMRARARFIMRYPNAGSNIDADVHLTSMADLVHYFPRAAAIGFLAPFPPMWFAAGKEVGSTGRWLAGSETLAMYAVEVLACFGLWRERRRLSAWLLIASAATGIIALGFVVINVGALFRLRYVFLILLVVLASAGAEHILSWSKDKREKAKNENPQNDSSDLAFNNTGE